MSLINDALKRAKESHGQHAPPPGAPMHPIEPPHHGGMPAWLWLIIIILCVGIGAFLIGQAMHNERVATSNAAATNAVMPPVVQAEPVKANPQTEIASQPTPQLLPEPKTEVVTNPLVPAVAPVATTPQLKLQSIIFDPRRPSIMINGKLLFVGDRVSEFRVVEIQRNSATLVGAGQTNVLLLEE